MYALLCVATCKRPNVPLLFIIDEMTAAVLLFLSLPLLASRTVHPNLQSFIHQQLAEKQ